METLFKDTRVSKLAIEAATPHYNASSRILRPGDLEGGQAGEHLSNRLSAALNQPQLSWSRYHDGVSIQN